MWYSQPHRGYRKACGCIAVAVAVIRSITLRDIQSSWRDACQQGGWAERCRLKVLIWYSLLNLFQTGQFLNVLNLISKPSWIQNSPKLYLNTESNTLPNLVSQSNHQSWGLCVWDPFFLHKFILFFSPFRDCQIFNLPWNLFAFHLYDIAHTHLSNLESITESKMIQSEVSDEVVILIFFSAWCENLHFATM